MIIYHPIKQITKWKGAYLYNPINLILNLNKI